MSITDFLAEDNRKVQEIIEKYPLQIPTKVAAELLGTTESSMREFLSGSAIGMSWRKAGSTARGFAIPTAQFVRWYLNIKEV